MRLFRLDGKALTINRLPANKPVKIAKAVRSDSLTILITEKGTLYHTNHRHNKFGYMSHQWPWRGNLLKCLHEVGVLPDDEYQKHLDYMEKYHQKKDNGFNTEQLNYYAGKLGIKLTQGQINKLNKLPR